MAYDPICTIDGEARCWSPAEVGEALERIFCDGGSPDKSCFPLEPSRTTAVHVIEDPVRPVAPATPPEPKLDASGVPEFNAFEEGCDD
ncbi:MAG: hypothetical protein IMF05_14240 [Proteobacteria bacterium]|nr:hypothetical protein [Pseudomonadota bacterium]